MSRSELVCNWVLGLSAIGWAVQIIVVAEPAARWNAVILTLAALYGLVGILFLIRSPLRVASPPSLLLAALPSLVLGTVVLKLATPHPWPIYAQAMFVAGGVLTIAALACLGRSFAVLPGVRQIVVRGPYRVMRHPAYAGQCLMLLGVCLAGPNLATAGVFVAAVAFVVVRILAEERTLLAVADYQAYAREHRWRLLPGVW